MPRQPSLAHVLDAEPPATVQALPDDVQLRLAGHVDTARRRQSDLISSSVDAAIRGVPLPVRGIVKKALLG